MNIGEVSKLSGISAKTIRYYEDIGLVTPQREIGNGYRVYSHEDLSMLGFLQRARKLGFSVKQCRELLSLYQDRDRSSKDVRDIASKHLLEIESRLKELAEMRKILSDLVDKCHGDDRPNCPILSGLSEGDSN